MEKQEVINTIRDLLNLNEQTPNIDNRIIIVKAIFSIVLCNYEVLFNNKKFYYNFSYKILQIYTEESEHFKSHFEKFNIIKQNEDFKMSW